MTPISDSVSIFPFLVALRLTSDLVAHIALHSTERWRFAQARLIHFTIHRKVTYIREFFFANFIYTNFFENPFLLRPRFHMGSPCFTHMPFGGWHATSFFLSGFTTRLYVFKMLLMNTLQLRLQNLFENMPPFRIINLISQTDVL